MPHIKNFRHILADIILAHVNTKIRCHHILAPYPHLLYFTSSLFISFLSTIQNKNDSAGLREHVMYIRTVAGYERTVILTGLKLYRIALS